MYCIVGTSLLLLALFTHNVFLRLAAIGALMGGGSVYFLFRYIYAPWQTKRQYRVNTSAQEQVVISQTEEGLHFKTRSGEAVIRWHEIVQWRESKDVLLIYQAADMYHIIPKRIADLSQEIIKTLNQKVGNAG